MRLHLLAASLLTASLFAADPGLVSLAIPDSQVMAGVNVEQVLLSPFGQQLAQPSLMPDPNLQKLLESAGFDPRRDLREILVSVSSFTEGGSGIFLARGTFDVPKILEAAKANGATVEAYKDVPIIQKSKGDALALPDSTLAIAGDVASVRAAIDRISTPTAISAALAVQVNQLSTTEDAWFVSIVPPLQLLPKAPAASGAGPGPFAMLGNVLQFSGGVKFGVNAVVTLQAVSKTDQDAATLAALLKTFASAADLYLPKDTSVPSAALLKDLNVTSEGPVTTVLLTVPESLIEEMKAANTHEKHTGNTPHAHSQPMQRPAGGAAEGATPQRIRVGSEVQHAKLVQQAAPVYPPLALQARISGVVKLNAIIGKDGTVANLTVASGHPLLVPAAMEAVRQWVYAPTLLNGQAVEVATQIDVNFSLTQ
jgi:TonB family protein